MIKRERSRWIGGDLFIFNFSGERKNGLKNGSNNCLTIWSFIYLCCVRFGGGGDGW